VLVCAAVLAACAARVGPENTDGAPTDGRADAAGNRDVADAARDVSYRDTLAYDAYREDACNPDARSTMRVFECDPFRPTVGCPAGEGCYASVTYPDGPCGREVYGARCIAAGAVPANGFCMGSTECQPGHGCFVTGSGNRCLRLCRIDGGEPSCLRGQVCEPTDLPDFGACD